MARCADLTEQAKKAGLKFKVDMLVTPGSELVSAGGWLQCLYLVLCCRELGEGNDRGG